MSSEKMTAKKAATQASKAADKASKEYEEAASKATLNSNAAHKLRDAEAAFREFAEKLTTIESEIRKLVEELHDHEGKKTANPALKKLCEYLHDAETIIGHASQDMQKRAAEDKEDDDAGKMARKKLRAAGYLTTATSLEQAGQKLKGVATAVKDAKRAVEKDANDAAQILKNAAASIKKVADATRGTLKWPKYEIWNDIPKKISEQVKIAEENAKLAGRIAQETGLKSDEEEAKLAEGHLEAARLKKEEADKEYDSAMVAEVLLKVEGFFQEHKDQIYRRLEECNKVATDKPNGNMIFIAESLPIINGIIHVGSTRAELNNATEWVRKHWVGWEEGEAHPRIVLSALLFHYVMKTGVDKFKDSTDSKQRTAWLKIEERVNKLL